MAQTNYRYGDIPDYRRGMYDEQPGMVFSNWLAEQRLPRLVEDRMRSLAFDSLYGDWYRSLFAEPASTPHFGEYLQSIQGSDLGRLFSSYSMNARGYDPRRYIGSVRWVGF